MAHFESSSIWSQRIKGEKTRNKVSRANGMSRVRSVICAHISFVVDVVVKNEVDLVQKSCI